MQFDPQPESRSSAPLAAALARHLPDRPVAVRFWDGREVPATTPTPSARFDLRSPRAIGHLLRSPGELGLGRAYVCGDLDVDDLDGVVWLLGRWDAPGLGLVARLSLLAAALRVQGLARLPSAPAAELRPQGRLHTRTRDARAVRHHYDVSNHFFALFLDRSMTYSCAVWRRGATTLEEAQEAKLELICSKLGLRAGQRLLDIGCGWGSLAIHAASRHGASVVGVTLSEPQAELARNRVRQAGLDDRVEIQVRDYRDLAGERFDAVASVGMVEHVGESRIDEYAHTVAGLLGPQARFLNHGITRLPAEEHARSEFSERYVFADGEILRPSRMLQAFEDVGFQTLHVEELREDYAETLRHWAQRFDENLDEAIRIGGEERARVWRLYLRAARNGFEVGHNSVHQILCERLPVGSRAERPGTAAPWVERAEPVSAARR